MATAPAFPFHKKFFLHLNGSVHVINYPVKNMIKHCTNFIISVVDILDQIPVRCHYDELGSFSDPYIPLSAFIRAFTNHVATFLTSDKGFAVKQRTFYIS